MSSFAVESLVVLAKAIEAARKALRELDGEAVPASLRRVVDSSSGRLPPPLARSLLLELDTNEWLRDLALEQLGPEQPEGTGSISHSYLSRQAGWWTDLAGSIAELRTQAVMEEIATAQARLTDLTADVAAAKKKLKAARQEADVALSDAKAELKAGRRRLEEALARSSASLESALRERDALTATVELLQEEIAVEEATSQALAETARTLRKQISREKAEHLGKGDVGVTRDAVALSKQLDYLAAVIPVRDVPVAPGPDAPGDEARGGAVASEPVDTTERLTPPAGLRPDSGELVEWLHRIDVPYVLLIDGHNVLFHVNRAAATTAAARRRLVVDMAAFRSTAAVDPHVVIVFDSHLPGLREPEYRDGVELVYAEAGVTADEVIVEMAGAFTRPTVVVSSDRDVREGAEASRALTLWAEALGEWLG